MDTERLFREASRVRKAIEELPQELRPHNFDIFPNGCCGDTCLILGIYLHEVCEFPVLDYVTGARRSRADNALMSHAWLQLDAVIVDITADQFRDGPGPVLVTESSLWHGEFNVDVQRHPLRLSDYPGAVAYELRSFYKTILPVLTSSPTGDT